MPGRSDGLTIRNPRNVTISNWIPSGGEGTVQGDLAVTGETSLDGGLGADVDAKGNYILNNQDKINSDSKGTVYHFDGAAAFVNIDALAAELVNLNNTVGAICWRGSINDITTNFKALWEFGDTNALEYITMRIGSANGTLNPSCAKAGTEQWNWISTATFDADTEMTIILVQDGTEPKIYVNGILQSGAFGGTDADRTAWFHSTTLVDNGRIGCSNNNSSGNATFFHGTSSDFGYINYAPTLAQVIDHISGNTLFEYQGGAQTAKLSEALTANQGSFDLNVRITATNESVGGDTASKIEIDGTATNNHYISDIVGTSYLTVGKRYKVLADIYIPSSNAVFNQLATGIAVDSSSPATVNARANFITPTQDAWQLQIELCEQIFTAASVGRDLMINMASAGSVSISGNSTDYFGIKNINVIAIGEVAKYDQTSITANNWLDRANGSHGPVTGASVLNPKGIAVDNYNIPFFSITSGITANTGSVQGNTPLVSHINQISVCANAGDAVTLQAAKPGRVQEVYNDGAASCDVFPASGDNIDEAGADAAKAVAADKSARFTCTSAGHWSTIVTA